MIGVNSRTSCKQSFKEIKILMLASLCVCVCVCVYTYIHTHTHTYILDVTCFVKKILSISGAKL